MKKSIKILLIVIAVLVLICVGNIAYKFFIYSLLSSEQKLEAAQTAYEACLAAGRNEEDCRGVLAVGVRSAISTQKDELKAEISDKTKPLEQRTQALDMYYALNTAGGEEITDKEADFYFYLAFSQEIPVELGRMAVGYLLDTTIDNPRVREFQMDTARRFKETSEDNIKYVEMAVRSLVRAKEKKAEDIFLEILQEEGPAPHFWASQGLIQIGAVDKIPELLKIALNETRDVGNRSLAILSIEDMAEQYNIKDKQAIVESLKTLLNHQEYTIRAAAADAAESLTGQEYEIEEGTEAEIEEYISNTYLLDY